MKKSLVFLFSLMLLLTGCGGNQSNVAESTTSQSSETSQETSSLDVGSIDITGTGQVNILSLGGSYQEEQSKHWFKPFQEASGIETVEGSGFNFAQIKAMVETGSTEIDLLDTSADTLFALKQEGLLEKIDWNLIPKEYQEGIPDEMKDDYAFPIIQWAMVMVYNSEKYPMSNAPKNWADFWDVEKIPGKRASVGVLRPPVEQAALAMNDNLDELYPIDLDKSFDKVKEVRDHFIFSEGYAQVVQNFAQGEADMAILPNGRLHPLIQDGFPLEINWTGHLRFPNYLVIPKGAPNKDNAMKLLAYISNPEVLARIAEPTNYGPINTDAYDYIDPAVASLLPGHPDTADLGRNADTVWLGNHKAQITEMWNQVLISR